MNYTSMKVKDAMLKISQNEIYLPAIQRKFVWETDRIERLFDSIMRGYPIGTFLFWFVKGASKDEYTFYKFIQDYHERDCAWNVVAPKPDLRDEFIGVLDGQQRLNSMYVALQGSYAYRKKRGKWTNDASFPKRLLHLNLFEHTSEEQDNGLAYEFRFLTSEEASVVDDHHYWFLVKTVLLWKDVGPVFDVISKASEQYPQYKATFQKNCGPRLNTLWQRLCSDDVINYFSIHDQELDNVVDIFVRVNSAGIQLSRTDLLFSSIVAHWDEARSNIEATIKTLNGKGNKFAFDNDFVMRSCLVLTDLPILFKVNSFKKENIELIQTSWPKIREALETTADLLVEWGFSAETLPTLNAVIPIAYFTFKGGDIKASKDDLRQYLIRALLNQIYASKTDRVLGAIREHLRLLQGEGDNKKYTLRNAKFLLKEISKQKLPDGRTLFVDETDIQEILEEKKGAYTFMVLSLLYPQLKFDQIQFHQDHIHPWSQFTPSDLKKLGLPDEKIEQWREDRDKLPNLQLMEGATNQSKNDTPLVEWIETLGAHKAHFSKTNYFPADVGLKLEEFETFVTARKKLLGEKLKVLLS